MDKILLFLMLSVVVCNGRPPRHERNQVGHVTVNRRSASVLRAIALYANPFGWIGTPKWPRRPAKANRKTNAKTNI
ncbi:hypothetical protein GHT06_016117 [Daphnia sinensis]|uniref:Secreted protein n=1 Tax=Daphnia sinensis TaxID=1820382 RepID=A0AAD5LBT5_9CRUS|nr:hypothetical protein GHT06_016117 [Daphnia sinensis]